MKLTLRYGPVLAFVLSCQLSFGQGRIVINEFMPWSGCNTTSEFVELLNFGPGPMNIGCYIITNGTYSVTIPPNTIVQRGQYFLLSGQDILAQNCGNKDSAVHADLNWTTCNCTNVPIPTTGDGFLQNGGNANEKIVLLDPNLNVVDAVSRNVPASSSSTITTPVLAGGCASKTFNLGTMSISYESTNNSTGIDNSIARKVDGDCGWVKTTVTSAHAPNKTGSTASASYDFTAVSTTDCGSTTGSISIQVNSADVNSLFPMNYTTGFDVDGNEIFDGSDQYTYGVDNTAPTIDISNLVYGRYRITVASSSSCNLKSFDFFVFNCYTIVLPVKLLYFRYEGVANGERLFQFKVDDNTGLNNVVLEGNNGAGFRALTTLYAPFYKNDLSITSSAGSTGRYRLKLTSHSGVVSYSPEVTISEPAPSVSSWPNPVRDRVYVRLTALSRGSLSYTITNSGGLSIKTSILQAKEGDQVVSIPTEALQPGLYYLQLTGTPIQKAISLRFIK